MPSPPFILLDNPIHLLVKTQKTTSNMKNILAVTTALLGIMLRGERAISILMVARQKKSGSEPAPDTTPGWFSWR